MRRKIFIGTAHERGVVSVDYLLSVVDLTHRLAARGIASDVVTLSSARVANVRDELASMFLANDHTHRRRRRVRPGARARHCGSSSSSARSTRATI